jgi:coenzyme F420-0:L-glutamate ligase/coenzyme F420-1:gamma-L-glutamate ligase
MPLDEAGALRAFPVTGVGEVRAGDDVGVLLARALGHRGGGDPRAGALFEGDIVVVTQKIVSKAEGRMVRLDHADPAAKAALVESEAVRVLRRRGELLITETAHGFVCANAGVDLSNVGDGWAALLPVDPDRSARRIRAELHRRLGVRVGVIVSDTFGRTWRHGVTDVAIGCAGVAAVVDLRGTVDATGRELVATQVCVADELAAAAEVVMGKDRGIPAAVLRGVPQAWLREGSVGEEIVRGHGEDLFR